MRRRDDRPFSIPRPGLGSSWKQRGGESFPASSQSRSTGLIDERLIEGSQESSFLTKSQRQEPLSHQLNARLHALPTPQDEEGEDDMQLDAFDLELLAQSDGSAKRSYQPSITERFPSYQPRQVDPPKQVSRFFNEAQATPHRSFASSSSDIDARNHSSPLAGFPNGRATGAFQERGLGTQRLTQPFKPHSISPEGPHSESYDDAQVYNDPDTPFQNIPVSIRGIVLVPVRELPDKYRTLFEFPIFNAVQSKCFPTIYKGDDNIVLAAPTGSGKTVIMELAICRLLNTLKDEQFKVIYQAPTKSLCSERLRDWSKKFQVLGLQCAELTGDTDHNQLKNVKDGQIIITTPEKWDSMTRKWKDHARLMQLVKLFLIDEVHTLKEARGATLEAVVSRMKSIGSNVRFVALSATIPNSEDIATWLVTTIAGVAFHHAGLDPTDRHQVEKSYLEGKINIICCTSTLAVGVNLPCHLVIIKNTVGWQDGRCQEYSDLEVMQMLGRAGRPQFDDSATAVILTRKERVYHYERLVSGSESLESCLHLNLIDHLNAEIGLGNVTSIDSAASWLAGTFLFVRLRRNPTHYKLKEGANRNDEDEMLRQICEKDIKLLQECELVTPDCLRSTPFGDAMARYYIRFETMKILLALKPQSDVAQILSAISQAEEFRDIRLKAGEKSLYKEINKANDINYPINVDIALRAHKISLLIQSELGAVEFPSSEQFQKHKFAFQQDKNFVFVHANRLIRCVVDCQVHLGDSATILHALKLAGSLAARVWDNSPLQMKQIEQVGVVAVRKLAAAGIDSIEALEQTEPYRIEMALSRNPPFGSTLLKRLSEFPKLRVSVKMAGKDIKRGQHVRVRFKAEIAFMNEKCPDLFQRRPVHVCFVAETSDGRLADFRRISANRLDKGYEILLTAELKHQNESITCHVMCDEIAGTSRCAVLKPALPRSCFPRQPENNEGAERSGGNEDLPNKTTAPRTSTRRTFSRFDSDDLLFGEFLESEILDDWNAKSTAIEHTEPDNKIIPQRKASKNEGTKSSTAANNYTNVVREPERLGNGRWACNHKCKDKTVCKHFCCREGLTNPPKVSRKKSDGAVQGIPGSNQLTLSGSVIKNTSKSAALSGAGKKAKKSHEVSGAEQAQIRGEISTVPLAADSSSDYGDESFEDMPSPSRLFFGNTTIRVKPSKREASDIAHVDPSVFEYGDDWINDGISFPAQSLLIEPSAANNGVKEVCPVDLVSPEPQEMFSVPSYFDGSEGGQKRKLSEEDEARNRNTGNKRAKSCNTGEEQENDVLTSNEEDKAKDSETEACRKLAVPVEVPTGWEDIDPALLDEFRDLVEFY
ncbi:Sec63 Brl domain-containing protein [Aspergillus crustosus]